MTRAIILSASAGSGKTYQLALKYVCDVVRHPEKFRNILAVTFTNKATEEMKSRILREIDTLASGKESSYIEKIQELTGFSEAHIRSQAMRARTHILHDYSHFSVLTIDRFFQRILRAFIKELGVDLNYNIELDTKALIMRSADELIDDIADDKDLRKWMLEYAEERIVDGVKWDMRSDLRAMGDEIFKECANIGSKIDKNELSNKVNNIVVQANKHCSRIQELGRTAVKYMSSMGLTAADFKYGNSGCASSFEKYAAGELKVPTQRMLDSIQSDTKWYNKGADGNVIIAAAYLRPILTEICDIYTQNIELINTASILRDNYRSYALLGDLYAKISELCSRESLMILSETKNLLSTFINDSNAPFIYEKVGNRYEYFMIDEFQDTSLREWLNLRPLLLNAMASNPETPVFIVGDVKQSIYRWRGGDWRLLNNQAIADLGESSCDVRKLKDNFRSVPNIVRFNNEFISKAVAIDNQHLNTLINDALAAAKIDQQQHDELKDILANAYEGHEQEIKKSERDIGYTEICAFDEDLKVSPFIEAIESAVERGYRYRDILILVRGQKDADKVAKALFESKEQMFTSKNRSGGFNILTPESLSIENCDITLFIIAVLRLTIDPSNDIERGIYNKFIGNEFDHKFDQEELKLFQHIAHLSPMEAFEHIVTHFKLNERTNRIAYLQAMHEQIIAFTTSRAADIQHYLEWWDERGHKDSVRVEMTDNTIEITTIHKAKGLESRVVIIPYASWKLVPESQHQPVVWSQANKAYEDFIDMQFPAVYNSKMQTSAFSRDYYNELVMSHVDGINLLYVAVTRASKELYIYFPYNLNSKEKKKKDKKKDDESLNTTGALIMQVANSMYEKPDEIIHKDDRILYKRFRVETRTQQSINQGERADANIILNDYISHHPEVKVRHFEKRFWDEGLKSGSKSCRHGITLHRIFEKARSFDDLHIALQRLDSGCMIDAAEIVDLKHHIDEAMKNPIISEWFSDVWDDVKCESEIISREEVRRPDRVMIAGRRAVVVDYKFGEQRSESYKKQVREYVELLKKMGRYDAIEGYVWYIAQGVVERV